MRLISASTSDVMALVTLPLFFLWCCFGHFPALCKYYSLGHSTLPSFLLPVLLAWSALVQRGGIDMHCDFCASSEPDY